MSGPLKVLFVVNSEHGQANVVFAVAHELLIRSDIEVHLASFAELEPRIKEANAVAKRAAPNASAIQFHTLNSPSMLGALGAQGDDPVRMLHHEPGFQGGWRTGYLGPVISMCWTGEQYMNQFESVRELHQTLKTDVIVIDTFMGAGMDAAKMMGAKWMAISPNALIDIAHPAQPHGATMWKFPMFGTGWSYPIQWWRIPLNIILRVRLIIGVISSPQTKSVLKARKDAGITDRMPTWEAQNAPYLSGSLPILDYPMHIPDNMHGCGPLLIPSEPVEAVDPELAEWIQRGPLVLLNRGSHLKLTDLSARRTAKAIRMFRQQRPEVRVLWKLKPEPDCTEQSYAELKTDIADDMVRVVNWLKADPLAIMRTGKVICFINHGGANSCFEGIATGVPQVNLPAWVDCYDWSARCEYLGIGIWGNRHGGLELDADELAKALLKACAEPREENHSESSGRQEKSSSGLSKDDNLRVNAQSLAKRVGGSGSKKAATLILEYAQSHKEK